jgi:ubiquinone/menaquinone biosynthesis C-methylase UbiE
MNKFKSPTKYWQRRKINWNQSYWTPGHPHRLLILKEMLRFPFKSVYEVGCAAGANLANIHSVFKGAEVGGTDVNEDAIEQARKNLPYAKDLEVGTAEDIFFSDKSIDVVITDATLLYVSPLKIKKVVKEMARVTRNGIVLCEPYKEHWWQRFNLWCKEGLYVHNYPKLLSDAGFYDIKLTKMTAKDWPDSLWYTAGYIISAKC